MLLKASKKLLIPGSELWADSLAYSVGRVRLRHEGLSMLE